jgi:hypothetical protein
LASRHYNTGAFFSLRGKILPRREKARASLYSSDGGLAFSGSGGNMALQGENFHCGQAQALRSGVRKKSLCRGFTAAEAVQGG